MSEGWDRRQRQTRADVLAAAGQLIADGGVEAMTMRKLAERAGVAVATLYNQFGDRSGVLVSYVGSGLDQLERELDRRPARDPVDTTRGLFDAIDHTVADAESIWRPLFASLKSGPEAHGLGAVGERVVTFVAADLAKAAAEGLFAVDCDVDVLARHIFVTRMGRLQKWAEGAIDWDQYRSSSTLGLELILASVLAEPARSDAIVRSGVAP